MMSKKTIHSHKQQVQSNEISTGAKPKKLTPEQLQQISLEMCWASEMMPPYTFPAGLWYLY